MRGRISSNPGKRCAFENTDRIIRVVMSRYTYRYYYYYGPLSTGRDGQAMGCRRTMTM